MNKFLTLFLALALCSSCKSKINITIDNPSDEKIVVQFDNGPEIMLLSNEYKLVTIQSGKRTIQVNGAEVGSFEFREFSYLVNPLRAKYYIQTEEYSTFSENETDKNLPTVMIGDYVIMGDFELVEELVIPKSWNIPLNKPFPHAVRTNQLSVAAKKLWRAKDLEATIAAILKTGDKKILKQHK